MNGQMNEHTEKQTNLYIELRYEQLNMHENRYHPIDIDLPDSALGGPLVIHSAQ